MDLNFGHILTALQRIFYNFSPKSHPYYNFLLQTFSHRDIVAACQPLIGGGVSGEYVAFGEVGGEDDDLKDVWSNIERQKGDRGA